MSRRIGTGLLSVGACSACFTAPLLVALLGTGWAGALGGGWAWMAGAAVIAGATLVLVRRLERRRRPGCACPPA